MPSTCPRSGTQGAGTGGHWEGMLSCTVLSGGNWIQRFWILKWVDSLGVGSWLAAGDQSPRALTGLAKEARPRPESLLLWESHCHLSWRGGGKWLASLSAWTWPEHAWAAWLVGSGVISRLRCGQQWATMPFLTLSFCLQGGRVDLLACACSVPIGFMQGFERIVWRRKWWVFLQGLPFTCWWSVGSENDSSWKEKLVLWGFALFFVDLFLKHLSLCDPHLLGTFFAG